jgi:16S rRNA (guanine527-N7)-methyltransferase
MSIEEGVLSLRTVCAQNGLQLDDAQLGTLEQFATLLLDWNKKINLISRRDEENFWTSHILHSLSVLFKVNIPPASLILDLGTGGGLPGIPIKIVRPDLQFTLLDSTQKKINVVKEILQALGLHGIDAVWGRAEDVGKRKEHAHRYDLIVARAVAPLKDLVTWAAPFIKREFDTTQETRPIVGDMVTQISRPTLIALKGGDLSDELRVIQKSSRVAHVTVREITLKGSAQFEEGDKKIVLVEFSTGQTQKAEKS